MLDLATSVSVFKTLEVRFFWIEREGYGPESKHKSANDKWSLDKYDVIVYNTSMFDLTRGIGLWWSLHGSRMSIHILWGNYAENTRYMELELATPIYKVFGEVTLTAHGYEERAYHLGVL